MKVALVKLVNSTIAVDRLAPPAGIMVIITSMTSMTFSLPLLTWFGSGGPVAVFFATLQYICLGG